VITTLFDFQAKVRADSSRTLMAGLYQCPLHGLCRDRSPGGAYVTHQKDGRGLYLIGVSQRVRDALQVTRVQQFFRFFESQAAAEQASNS
jgi:hypothetical protein